MVPLFAFYRLALQFLSQYTAAAVLSDVSTALSPLPRLEFAVKWRLGLFDSLVIFGFSKNSSDAAPGTVPPGSLGKIRRPANPHGSYIEL